MPGSGVNPAVEVILADYRRYHAVLAIVAAVLLIAVLVLVLRCLLALRAARRSPSGATRRETWTYTAFALLGVLVTLFLMIVLVANIGTALSPEQGFAGIDQSGASFSSWVASGSPAIPADVQQQIDARLAWQRPKAIVTSILLVLTVVASVAIWRRWIRRADSSRAANILTFCAGVASIGVALILMLMVMGNVQASLAPIAITLVYG